MTSSPYLACGGNSWSGICKTRHKGCDPENIARTCIGAKCVGVKQYPNATIADHGTISGKDAMMKEIFNRGPIACKIAADALVKYSTGILSGSALKTDHVISVVGWGTDETEGKYWIVRNSWGEFWGEDGFVRVKFGSLMLDSEIPFLAGCAWATPKDYTAPEKKNDPHCSIDGKCEGDSKLKSLAPSAQSEWKSELLSRSDVEARGFKWRMNSSNPSSHDGLEVPTGGIPAEFTWCNKDGRSYCTASVNQHIPQYCGSCWAQASLSALADRIKIARNASGIDVQLSVQHLLNCGGKAGSCHGGDAGATYQWIKSIGDKTGSGIAYTTAQPYLACSSDSTNGFCKSEGMDWSCNLLNTARTCGGFGKKCVGLNQYPNATIAEHGTISGKDAMMKEIFSRGPIACDIDARGVANYTTGIARAKSTETNHVVSVVGWGQDSNQGLYWIVRNSWGEYWGEHGYVRIAEGAVNIESNCNWAVPKSFTAPELHNQFHCFEDGSNCKDEGDSSFVV